MGLITTTQTKKEKKRELWTGLIGVVPNPGNACFGEAQGAYVNVVTLAINITAFRKRIKQSLDELDMTLIEIEGAEPLQIRISRTKPDEEMLQMAETALKQDSVVFGTFYTYNDENE